MDAGFDDGQWSEEHIIKIKETPEECLGEIDMLLSEGKEIEARNYAFEASERFDSDTDRQFFEKRMQIERNIIELHPVGETRVTDYGIFWSVCCDELKEAVLQDKIGVNYECMTCIPSLVVTTKELIQKVCSGDDCRDTDCGDWDYVETDVCPFCGKTMYDYVVDESGTCPNDPKRKYEGNA